MSDFDGPCVILYMKTGCDCVEDIRSADTVAGWKKKKSENILLN